MSKLLMRVVLGCVCLFAIAGPAKAIIVPRLFQPSPQASSTQEARLTKLEQQTTEAKNSADNSWMLTSSALVLMMTGPGLALFYGGLVRKKNVLSTMMQSFAMMAVITIVWALFGYSLAFGGGTSFIGDLHHIFLRGVGSRLIRHTPRAFRSRRS